MTAAHPFGAFVSCRFKRIGCVRTIKVNPRKYSWYCEFWIFSHLYPDLLEDEDKFHGFLRRKIEQFYCLSQLVGEEIKKQTPTIGGWFNLKNDLQFIWSTCHKYLLEIRRGLFILLELPFFLISVLDSYLPIFTTHFFNSIYIAGCLFRSIRIVTDIRTQDPPHLLQDIRVML